MELAVSSEALVSIYESASYRIP